jgi:hypothetical protein
VVGASLAGLTEQRDAELAEEWAEAEQICQPAPVGS